MLMTAFLIAFVIFVGYAMYKYYAAQPLDKPIIMRVLASMMAAAAAIGGAVYSWLQNPNATP